MKTSFPAWKFKSTTFLAGKEEAGWSSFVHLPFQPLNTEKSCHQQNKTSIAQWLPHHRAATGFLAFNQQEVRPKFLEMPPGQSILPVSLSV